MTAIHFITVVLVSIAVSYLFRKCCEWWDRRNTDNAMLRRHILDLETELLRSEIKLCAADIRILDLRVDVLSHKMRAFTLELELLTRDLMLTCLYAEMQRRASRQTAHVALDNPTHVIIDQDGNVL